MYCVSQAKIIAQKMNRIRKQNWSAPTIMAAFILICMIIIFSFESMGLSNKEKNLDYRISTPEKFIKVVTNDVRTSNCFKNEDSECRCICSESSDSMYRDKFQFLTLKDKEKQIMTMKNILVEAAKYQYDYENNIANSEGQTTLENKENAEQLGNDIFIFDM